MSALTSQRGPPQRRLEQSYFDNQSATSLSWINRDVKKASKAKGEGAERASFNNIIKYLNREPMRKNNFFTEELKVFQRPNDGQWSERDQLEG
jgi:hypothetical protein